MLTKDLLRYRVHKQGVHPQLLEPDSPELLAFAESLLALFAETNGQTRTSLQERVNHAIAEFPDNVTIARGLEKLLLDRTKFDEDTSGELPALREKVFAASGAQLASGLPEHPEEYRREIAVAFGVTPEALEAQLYQDLSAHHPVLAFKPLSPEGLLHRYNCAQVQGLLIRCAKLDLEFPESEPARLRQLLKSLRFHQLLARISRTPDGATLVQVDGPLSLFVQTQKYGFNLANFFPALLHQPGWILRAEVQVRKSETHQLKLDSSCGIRSHYRPFLAYVPEALQLLQQNVAAKLPEWTLEAATDFLALEGEQYCFPDFLLKHQSGTQVPLELFHGWHTGPLRARLAHLANCPEPPLLLGIARTLLKDVELNGLLEASDYFQSYGFLFRDTPSVERLRPVLERWLGLEDSEGLPLFRL